MINNISKENSVEIIFNDWKLFLKTIPNILLIKIDKYDSNDIYQSSFKLNYLQTLNLFKSKISINEIFETICILIYQNNIKIEENGKKLILNSIDELNLEKKEKIYSKNDLLLDTTIIKSIKIHDEWIRSINVFPSGNIISVSNDKSIKIFDNDFNNLQIILNAHEKGILYVHIINEFNFITCSKDKNIKFWMKNNNFDNFYLKETIINAHKNWITNVINYKDKNIISCSNDKTVKIWEKINNKYQLITILKHEGWVNSILILENKNLLISSGGDGTKFWNLHNYKFLNIINGYCNNNNALKLIDDNTIIVGGYNGFISVISITQRKIIKIIVNEFFCLGISVFQDMGIFICGGLGNNIKIYRIDNCKCIHKIENIHEKDIFGFCKLNNNLIVSFGKDHFIKILSINKR